MARRVGAIKSAIKIGGTCTQLHAAKAHGMSGAVAIKCMFGLGGDGIPLHATSAGSRSFGARHGGMSQKD